MSVQSYPVYDLPFLNIYGLITSNNATTPNSKVDISTGQCRDSNNIIDIIISTAFTIDCTTNGFNGLDTGSLAASTWYSVYAIADSSGNQIPGGIITLKSNAAPLLPFGYDSYRLINYMLTDGSSHFLKFYDHGIQDLRAKFWDAGASVLSAGSATSATAIDLSAGVPPINKLPVLLSVSFTPNAAGNTVSFRPTGSSATSPIILSGVVASQPQIAQLQVMSLLSSSVAKIDYINSAASGSTSVSVVGFQFSV